MNLDTLSRRTLLRWTQAAGCGLALAPWLSARAEGFPTRPLRIVVPNAPGGAADQTARAVAQKLSESLKQPVVVENRPGAGGVVAGELVAKAEPDGHTLLLVSSGTAVSQVLFKALPFDAQRDFAPVSTLARFDLALVASGNGRFKTLADLLSWGRAHPGTLNVGAPNIGTTQHLAAELFKSMSGIDLQVIPFNGSPAVITALRGGEIDAGIDILAPLLPQIASGVLLPLAVLGEKRAPQLAQVPAVRESGGGLASYQASSWNGLAVPARTPREVVNRLNLEVQNALAQPDLIKRLHDLQMTPLGGSPQTLQDQMAFDIKRWGDVMARAKIAPQ